MILLGKRDSEIVESCSWNFSIKSDS